MEMWLSTLMGTTMMLLCMMMMMTLTLCQQLATDGT
jgi:hypothetical protein